MNCRTDSSFLFVDIKNSVNQYIRLRSGISTLLISEVWWHIPFLMSTGVLFVNSEMPPSEEVIPFCTISVNIKISGWLVFWSMCLLSTKVLLNIIQVCVRCCSWWLTTSKNRIIKVLMSKNLKYPGEKKSNSAFWHIRLSWITSWSVVPEHACHTDWQEQRLLAAHQVTLRPVFHFLSHLRHQTVN